MSSETRTHKSEIGAEPMNFRASVPGLKVLENFHGTRRNLKDKSGRNIHARRLGMKVSPARIL
jgi:hypothetical protein